jgi:hypothetical protein
MMISVKISYPDSNNDTEISRTISFSEEFIKDDIKGVLDIVKVNLKLIIAAADKDIWYRKEDESVRTVHTSEKT